jgi:hypothetical protein
MITVERAPSERVAQCVHRGSALFATIAIAIGSLATVVTGCTGPSRLPTNDVSISVAVKFVDGSGDPILTDERPEDASLLLGAIAGAIAGRPKGTLQTASIAKRPTIEIDLSSFSAAIEPQAATMTATEAGAGLEIAPADTKFARASTILKWRGPPSGLSIRFVDSDDSSILTLVFFDRPCRLTGTVKRLNSHEKLTTIYDATIEKAGLNWLVATPKGSTESVVHAAPAAIRPTLVIRPATT